MICKDCEYCRWTDLNFNCLNPVIKDINDDSCNQFVHWCVEDMELTKTEEVQIINLDV